jgi:hypothetical protein
MLPRPRRHNRTPAPGRRNDATAVTIRLRYSAFRVVVAAAAVVAKPVVVITAVTMVMLVIRWHRSAG